MNRERKRERRERKRERRREREKKVAPKMSFEEEEGGEEVEGESLEIEVETDAASGVGVSSRGSASSSRQSGVMAALVVTAGVGALALVKLLVWGRRGRERRRYLIEKLDLEPAPCPLPPHKPLPLTGRSFVFEETIAKRAKSVELLRKAGARGVGKVRKESAEAAVKDECCDLALGSGGAGAAAGVFGMKGTDGTCWFAKDVALLRQAGQVLLQAKEGVEPKCPGKFLIASDLFSDSPLLLVAQRACQKLLGSANVTTVKLSNFLSKRKEDDEEALGDALNDALQGKVLVVPTLALVPGTSTLPCISLGKPGISLISSRNSDLLLLDTAHAMSSLAAEAYEECKDAGGLSKNHWANSLKEQGNKAFRDGEFFEAVQFYSQGIGVDSSNPVLYSNRAMAYLKLGNFVEAERDCTLALDIDPSNVKALLRRGTARAYLAEFHGALNDFSKVMEVEPSNAQAMQEIGRIKQAFATPTPQEG